MERRVSLTEAPSTVSARKRITDGGLKYLARRREKEREAAREREREREREGREGGGGIAPPLPYCELLSRKLGIGADDGLLV